VKLKIKALLNTKPQQQHSQLHLIDLPESEGGEKKREHEEKAKREVQKEKKWTDMQKTEERRKAREGW